MNQFAPQIDKLLTQCRVAAMNLLARREHSCQELFHKLTSRDFEKSVVEQVLLALEQENLLSDMRFTEAFVRSKAMKGFGPLRIRQELVGHGVEESLISDYINGQQWVSLAAEVRQKRFGNQLPNDYKERARQMRFLQYRGFSTDQINSAMKEDVW